MLVVLDLAPGDWRALFLALRYVEALVSHNNSQLDKEKSPAFFANVTRSGGNYLYACPGLHRFLFCPDVVNGIIAKTLKMQEAIIIQPQRLLEMMTYSMMSGNGRKGIPMVSCGPNYRRNRAERQHCFCVLQRPEYRHKRKRNSRN